MIIGSLVRSNQALEYSVSKFGRTTTFMSAGGNDGRLTNVFIGVAIPAGFATLVNCLRVTSMVTKG
jgi:hypothetical protein